MGSGGSLAGSFARPDAGFLGNVLDVRTLHDGHTVRPAGLDLTSRAVTHDVETYGLRAACEGKSFASSGDSGLCAALTRLARDADLFRCEADLDGHHEGGQAHLTPEDAGAVARAPGARELLVTQAGPTLTPEAATARAAVSSGGPTATAREGRTYPV
ncbi:MBL fold metallo-hydrolase [Streptomyces incanus]|uniref:MBL fold metallo-hydrolase n=1 Tax=Streptomyces incanus TaxID=887453 RepID=A0ABW0XPK7_9ACTN